MKTLNQNIKADEIKSYSKAGIVRRLLVLFYDTLLTVAAIFIAFQPIPLAENLIKRYPLIEPLSSIYLLAIWFLFFGWFWTHGGQTVGMKAWRIILHRQDGKKITWADAFSRFLISNVFFLILLFMIQVEVISIKQSLILAGLIFSISYIWAIFDRENRTLHDLFSRTRISVLETKKLK